MGIITRMLKQTAVYWPLASTDSGGDDFDKFGYPIVTDPIEIKCRWEDVNEEFIDAKGTKRLSKSKVYVDRDIGVSGLLMLGEIADIVEIDPRENDSVWEIKRFDKIPNLKATEFLRMAYL